MQYVIVRCIFFIYCFKHHFREILLNQQLTYYTKMFFKTYSEKYLFFQNFLLLKNKTLNYKTTFMIYVLLVIDVVLVTTFQYLI